MKSKALKSMKLNFKRNVLRDDVKQLPEGIFNTTLMCVHSHVWKALYIIETCPT